MATATPIRPRDRTRTAAAAGLDGLRNLGPQSRRMLAAAGIRSPATLKRTGALAAYQRVRAVVPGASLNLLYALVGALEDIDWREVRRTRKLALLMALEQAREAAAPRPRRAVDDLLALRNIGPAMRGDLVQLGVRSVAQLARHEPDRLYLRLQRITGQRQDPCVWDTFSAAIHQARTGEALPWWHFTAERKRRMAAGTFVRTAKAAPVRRARAAT